CGIPGAMLTYHSNKRRIAMDTGFRQFVKWVWQKINPHENPIPGVTTGNVVVVQVPNYLPPLAEVDLSAQGKSSKRRLAGRGTTYNQCAMMGMLVQNALGPANAQYWREQDMFTGANPTFKIAQPHFVVRSDNRSWDEIVAAGGFGARGQNISCSAHVGYE